MTVWTKIIMILSLGLIVILLLNIKITAAPTTPLKTAPPAPESLVKQSTSQPVTNPLSPLRNPPTATATNSAPVTMLDSQSLPPTLPPAPTFTNQKLMAWIYPYQPACLAPQEYADGRKIDVLKPEFFTITGGSLLLLDESRVTCNGYSPTFVSNLQKFSTEQFVTVSSASAEDMATFLERTLTDDTDIKTLVNFIVSNNLTGIELNFEDFGSWTPKNYLDFKNFVTRLGTSLHAEKKQLMIIGPPVANAVEEAWFLWRYEDFTTLPVDHMVVMGYDYQFDHGAGEPIAPLTWLHDTITWISARYPLNKLTLALPSYGYESRAGVHEFSILTYEQIRSRPGFETARRDPKSYEMTWQQGTTVYFYQDSVSLTKKRELATALGIQSFSVWHLGGNPWFE